MFQYILNTSTRALHPGRPFPSLSFSDWLDSVTHLAHSFEVIAYGSFLIGLVQRYFIVKSDLLESGVNTSPSPRKSRAVAALLDLFPAFVLLRSPVQLCLSFKTSSKLISNSLSKCFMCMTVHLHVCVYIMYK